MKFVPETERVIDTEQLETEWQNAEHFGKLALGESVMFFPGISKKKYLPYSQVVWAYMRQEDSTARLCCGTTTIESFYLMVVTADGKKKKTPVERAGDIKKILEVIQERCPLADIGYSKEKAEKYLS